ncbi:MAG: hypothetical protein GY944_28090 [bacterium]|nr:hypothetical protein [bacterium]
MTTAITTVLFAALCCAGLNAQDKTEALLAGLEKSTDTVGRCALIEEIGALAVNGRVALPVLAKWLTEGQVDERIAATSALVRLAPHASSVIPVLAPALRHRDASVRNAARTALAAISAQTIDLSVLIADLDNPSYQVRRTALMTVARHGVDSAPLLEKLIDMLEAHQMRNEIARTLVGLGERLRPGVTVLLRRCQAAPGFRLSSAHVEFLKAHAQWAAVAGTPVVAQLVGSTDPGSAVNAISILVAFARWERSAWKPLASLVREGSSQQRDRVLSELGRFRGSKCQDDAVALALESVGDERLVDRALYALRQLGPAVSPVAVALLAHAGDAEFARRSEAFATAVQIGITAELTSDVAALVTRPDVAVAAQALHWLLEANAPELAHCVHVTLEHEAPELRRLAVLALAFDAEPMAADVETVRGLTRDESSEVALAAQVVLTILDKGELGTLRFKPGDLAQVVLAVAKARRGELTALLQCTKPPFQQLAARELGRLIAEDVDRYDVVLSTAIPCEALASITLAGGDLAIFKLLSNLDHNFTKTIVRVEVLVLIAPQVPWLRPVLEQCAVSGPKSMRQHVSRLLERVPPAAESVVVPDVARSVVANWYLNGLIENPKQEIDASLFRIAIHSESPSVRSRALDVLLRLTPARAGVFLPTLAQLAAEDAGALFVLVPVAAKCGVELSICAPKIWDARITGTDRQRARIALALHDTDPIVMSRKAICMLGARDSAAVVQRRALWVAKGLPARDLLEVIIEVDGGSEAASKLDASSLLRLVPAEDLIRQIDAMDGWLARATFAEIDAMDGWLARATFAEMAAVVRAFARMGRRGLERLKPLLRAEVARARRSSTPVLDQIAQAGISVRPLAPLLFELAGRDAGHEQKTALRALVAMQLHDADEFVDTWTELIRTRIDRFEHVDDPNYLDVEVVLKALPGLGARGCFAIPTLLAAPNSNVWGLDPHGVRRFDVLVSVGASDVQILDFLEKHIFGPGRAGRELAAAIGALGDRGAAFLPTLSAWCDRQPWVKIWLAEVLNQVAPNSSAAGARHVLPFVLALADDARAWRSVARAVASLPTRSAPGLLPHLQAFNREVKKRPAHYRSVAYAVWELVAPICDREQSSTILQLLMMDSRTRRASPDAVGQLIGRFGPRGVDMVLRVAATRELREGLVGGLARTAPDLVWENRKRFSSQVAEILYAFGSLPPEPWIGAVSVSFLDHENETVRDRAVSNLYHLGRAAVPRLRKLLGRVAEGKVHFGSVAAAMHKLGPLGAALRSDLVRLHAKVGEAEQKAIRRLLPRLGPRGLAAFAKLDLSRAALYDPLLAAMLGGDLETFAVAMDIIGDHQLLREPEFATLPSSFAPLDEPRRDLFLAALVRTKAVPEHWRKVQLEAGFSTSQLESLLPWLVRYEDSGRTLRSLSEALMEPKLRSTALQLLPGLGRSAHRLVQAVRECGADPDLGVRERAAVLLEVLAPLHAACVRLEESADAGEVAELKREVDSLAARWGRLR